MSRMHVYADESGDFNFSRDPGASKYFILTTVSMADHAVATDLLELRRSLTWLNHELSGPFHATEERQVIRDAVFDVLKGHDFRIDATILEKAKCRPYIYRTEERFYKTAWYFHMKHVTPRLITAQDDLLVVAASLGTPKKRTLFHAAVRDVMTQCSPSSAYRTASWPAAIDPCLQVADYCCWAIQKKWERGDSRSYDLIKDKVRSEFDLFRPGRDYFF